MGPYPIIEVEFWIGEKERGAYVIGQDSERPTCIGVSDDLRSEIENVSQTAKGKWFEFYQSISPFRLFEVQCEWYHKYDSLRERGHPKPPSGTTQVKCPIEGCGYKL